MNLESQVCSLKWAKKLKELGVKQKSSFYWFKQFPDDDYLLHYIDYIHYDADVKIFKDHFPDNFSAFTASELLTILPHRVTINSGEPYNSFRLRIEKTFYVGQDEIIEENFFTEDIFIVNYYCDTTSAILDWNFTTLINNITDTNLSNALAKMLIYLLENILIINEENINA